MNTKSATSTLRKAAMILVAFAGAWSAPSFAGTSDSIQTIDELEVFGAPKLLRLKDDESLFPIDSSGYERYGFVGLNATNSGSLRACQTSNINGTFCLDGNVVRRWPTVVEHPLDSAATTNAGEIVFSCLDPQLALDNSASPGLCTAMTVDSAGNIWFAGRISSVAPAYSLFKVVKKTGSPATCPGAATSFSDLAGAPSSYCFERQGQNRNLITDLSPLEGELVDRYLPFGGKGLLGVESRNTVVFYPFHDMQNPVVMNDWAPVLTLVNLIQSATILQREVLTPDPVAGTPTTVYTYGLIATNSGRVFWRRLGTADAPAIYLHANSPTDPNGIPRGDQCETVGANIFGVRASETTGNVYVTNRNYCIASAVSNSGTGANLVPVTLATVASRVISVPTGLGALTDRVRPIGLSVSPGSTENVLTCTDPFSGCSLIGDGSDSNGYPGIRMYGVTLEPGSPSNLSVYLVKGLLDCRYIDRTGLPTDHPCYDAIARGIIIPDPKAPTAERAFPQRQYLNITPMLPPTVTDLFDASGKKPTGLPEMLISPRYRAQKSNGYEFEGIFGKADPNIRFRKTFTVEFDIADTNLAGQKLGCGVFQTAGNGYSGPLPFNKLDIATVVSERYSSVGGPLGILYDPASVAAEHVDHLVNKGCYNPLPAGGSRWSMWNYNLELAEDVFVPASGNKSARFTYSYGTTYLGNLLVSLHSDLGVVQREMACKSVDAAGDTTAAVDPPPLSTADCENLALRWKQSQDRLADCVKAINDPKQSAFNQACGAFESQFSQYKTLIEGLILSGPDPANRAGELWARSDVIKHFYYDQLLKARDLCKTNKSFCTAAP